MTDCASILPELPAFVDGELEGLPAQRVEAHLANCDACRGVAQALTQGFDVAREPVRVDDDVIERGLARLPPLPPHEDPSEKRERRRASRLVTATLAAAALVYVAVVAGIASWDALSARAPGERFAFGPAPPPPAAPPAAAPLDEAPAAAEPLQPLQPAPGVRMLAQAEWRGRTERDGAVTRVALERGLVAFALAPAKGRRLLVSTGDVEVDVIGTRFVVDARDDGTTVAVASGRVRLREAAGGAQVTLSAGEALRVARGGAGSVRRPLDPGLAALLDDAHLVEGERPPKPEKPAPAAAAAAQDLAACARAAQSAAGDGKHARAVALYDGCVAAAGADNPLRDVLRYESARLEAFDLQRPSGRAALAKLTGSRDREVARQAALSLCELDVGRDPCGARACLDRLTRRDDAVLVDSARRLALRWRLPTTCAP